MGGDDPDPPFFFSKPADAVVPSGAEIPYPSGTADLHHEVELVAALGAGGADVAVADALSLVYGYAVGVDLTRRDLQAAARVKGQPWDAAKGFDNSAPIGVIRPADGPPPQGSIRLTVNGQVRQDALVADMIWDVANVIAQASRLWRLAPGDLIFTGTPEGVGPLVSGDAVVGEIEGRRSRLPHRLVIPACASSASSSSPSPAPPRRWPRMRRPASPSTPSAPSAA